jgi:hypothetical protein
MWACAVDVVRRPILQQLLFGPTLRSALAHEVGACLLVGVAVAVGCGSRLGGPN